MLIQSACMLSQAPSHLHRQITTTTEGEAQVTDSNTSTSTGERTLIGEIHPGQQKTLYMMKKEIRWEVMSQL